MGGAQSIFTCAYDEAFQIPTEFSAEIALRTQQIIAYESGIGKTVDPLGRQLSRRVADRPHGGGDLESHPASSTTTAASKRRSRTDICRAGSPAGGAAQAAERRRIAGSVAWENFFARLETNKAEYGKVFSCDPTSTARIQENLRALRASRDSARVRGR